MSAEEGVRVGRACVSAVLEGDLSRLMTILNAQDDVLLRATCAALAGMMAGLVTNAAGDRQPIDVWGESLIRAHDRFGV